MENTKKTFLVWALIIGLMGYLLMKGCSNPTIEAKTFNKPEKQEKQIENEPLKIANIKPTPAQPAPEEVDKWSYSSKTDQMDSTVTKFANITSENTFHFPFPYGESNSDLMIRKRAEDGLSVMFSVSSGQIVCHSSCTVKVRFDDKPAKIFRANPPNDYDSKYLFLSPASKFVSELKKAKKTLVEVTYYSSGSRISEFKTEGFKWE